MNGSEKHLYYGTKEYKVGLIRISEAIMKQDWMGDNPCGECEGFRSGMIDQAYMM